jgi:hypothetical protein
MGITTWPGEEPSASLFSQASMPHRSLGGYIPAMANAVFTTKAQPVYDDLPEWKYHFPKNI